MTLERTVSVTTFMADHQVKTSLDHQILIDADRGYRTIPHTPKSSVSRNSRKDHAATGLTPLSKKTASEQTFVTCSSNTGISKAVCPSEDFDFRHLVLNSRVRNGEVKTPASAKGERSRSYLPNSDGGGQRHGKTRQYKKRPEKRRSTGSGSNGEAAALDFHSVPPGSCVSFGDATSAKQSNDTRSLQYSGSKTAPLPQESPRPAKSCAFSYIFRRSRKSRSRHREHSTADRENCRPRPAQDRTSAKSRLDSTSSSSFQLPVSPNNHKNTCNTETEDRVPAGKSRDGSGDPLLSPGSPVRATQNVTLPQQADGQRLHPERSGGKKQQSRSRSERRPLYATHSPVPRDRSEDAFYRNPHSSSKDDSPSSEDQRVEDTTRPRSAGHCGKDINDLLERASDSKDLKNRNRFKSKSQQSVRRPDPNPEDDDSHHHVSNSNLSKTPSKARRQSVPNLSGLGIYNSESDAIVLTDADDFEYRPSDMKGALNLSFCGCGFLGMYHLGVATCLVQRAPALLDRIRKVGGASAGALMGAVLVTCPEKMEASGVLIHNMSKEIRSKPLGALTPGYTFTKSMRNMLDGILPEDAHQKARGRLFVSLTDATTKKNVLMTDFKTRDELIEALIASCHIPVYAGMKSPSIRGTKYMDGGLSDNMPKFESGRTIGVSPFDGKSDIGPKPGQEADKKAHFVNLHNQDYQVSMRNFRRGAHAFFPPRRHVLQEYFEKGRYDASRFLIREGCYEIHVPDQSKKVVYESSV